MSVAAAQAVALQNAEEEAMTPYTPADLAQTWEFKIIRSATNKFRDPEFQARILAEEARAGWVLLEKFDDARLRLKRPTSARAGDAGRTPDPYRISVGPGAGLVLALILGGCVVFSALVIGAVILTVFLTTGR